ncbi:MAG TPA: endolytic transglycosylase MltG, partial [Ktedonobacterales bacterium]|nr:endolytic transglycosylase MltG [Ktedonobacterales bacterium]
MKAFGRIVLVVVTVLVFGVSFAGATVAFDITQPSVSGSTQTVRFVVVKGDTTTSIADRLQQEGLIRNAELFKLLARYRHLDRSIEPGTYYLSAGMTMDQIVLKLQHGIPDVVEVTVPDALRVTQYPTYITGLPNFDGATFLKIAKTGIEPDGTKLWQKYWYVAQPGEKVAYALEGYLYPDTYEFDRTADTVSVVETMLNELGDQLCPGPVDQPNSYIFNKAQCKAHAIKVGGQNIFTAMEQNYSTTNDTLAL